MVKVEEENGGILGKMTKIKSPSMGSKGNMEQVLPKICTYMTAI